MQKLACQRIVNNSFSLMQLNYNLYDNYTVVINNLLSIKLFYIYNFLAILTTRLLRTIMKLRTINFLFSTSTSSYNGVLSQ